MYSTIRFAGERWDILKKENGKTLLAFSSGFFGNESLMFRTKNFFERDCSYFYKTMREYLNVTFSNYVFSESDKKHIVVIQNKYPVVSWEKDDLGFSTTNFKMEVQKDRVFPLRYVDICGLSSRELTDICSLRKGDKVILLPQNIDKNQRIPTISYHEDWKTGRSYQQLEEFSFETLERDIKDDESYLDSITVIPAIWVDSSIT